MSLPVVLSVGQCSADHGSLTRLFRQSCQVTLIGVDSPQEALDQLGRREVALVLVNRILDATGESGIDFIGLLKENPATNAIPVMLVSNYREAQDRAIQLGALPGFGKDALGRPETIALLREVLPGGSPRA